MRKQLLTTVAISFQAVLTINGPAQSTELASDVSATSIDGGGRNIMRTADGGIVVAFSTIDSNLIFGRSLDNGVSWNNFPLKDVTGTVLQTAIDSNFQGSYIAFTENVNGRTAGRIAFSSAPFSANPQLVVSRSVTPEGVVPQDTFIQASRAGWGDFATDNRETVVYGWQDSISKGLYIGVSPDGRTFPMAQLVVDDEFAASGPAVAIRGNYVVATYQTASSAMAPADVPEHLRKGRTYPAWLESFDGGRTWSPPRPLFGLTSAAFPKVGVETTVGGFAEYRLAGGSLLPNSPILNWAGARSLDGGLFDADKTLPTDEPLRDQRPSDQPPSDTPPLDSDRKTEFDPSLRGTTFVQTSMKSIDGEKAEGEVSIVSFRPIEPGAGWTHVVANNRLTASKARVDSITSHLSAKGSQFQYSALIDTAVRATTYKEVDPFTQQARLVVAVSTDTGKTFKNHVSFSHQELASHGISDFHNGSVFAVSQCLFESRNGEVHVDILFTSKGKIHFASIPIGTNASTLRSEDQSRLSSR